MRHPCLSTVLVLGLAAAPAVSQEWCQVVPQPATIDSHVENAAPVPQTGTPVIDLLAVVMPEAGPVPDVWRRIEEALRDLNGILANSEVPGIVRLVGVVPPPASLPRRAGGMLTAFANDPNVQRLRNEHGADLMTLLVPTAMLPEAFGIAFLSDHETGGYSVLRMEATGLLPHELGHNLGLPHDKPHSPDYGGPYEPRAYGHWGQLPDGRWFADVMSYGSVCPGGCDLGVPFFSNPEVSYLGAPMGIRGEREATLVLRNHAMRRVAAWRRSTVGDCWPSPTTLCVNNYRFKVEAAWDRGPGGRGAGSAVSLTNDTGYFWFFDPANVEVVVKVLNGCGLNQRYWVFAAGLTTVKVTLTVTDTVTGATKTYVNPRGRTFETITDVEAFQACE